MILCVLSMLTNQHLHSAIFDDLEAACVLVEIAQDPEQELEALTSVAT